MGLLQGWSLEATYPRAAELDAVREIATPAAIYLSAVATHSTQDLVAATRAVRARGFEPVPHLAARGFADAAALRGFLAAAEVRRVLLIGGDRDHPVGTFPDAHSVIASGALQAAGIQEIGIAGYPDGHPRLAEAELDRALKQKLAAAKRAGLRVHIVTQFCFDEAPILAWLRKLRREGIGCPVRIGLAGPTSVATLLRYAARCGVKASTRGVLRQAGAMRRLIGDASPDELVSTLAQACARENLGPVTAHFFSFGGAVRTAQWAAAAESGAQLEHRLPG